MGGTRALYAEGWLRYLEQNQRLLWVLPLEGAWRLASSDTMPVPFMSVDPTSRPAGIEDELRRLQGSWKQIAYERDGVVDPLDEQGWEPRTTFTGEAFVVTLADGTVPIQGTFRIDPTREPKTVDWTDTIGEDAGKTLLAIYTLQGDRFTFCAAYPGLERPKAFSTRPGQVLRTFRREPPSGLEDEA